MLFIEFKRVFYVYTFISIKMYTIFWCFLLFFFFLQNPITRLHNLVKLIHRCGYISYEHKDRRSHSISKRSFYIQKKRKQTKKPVSRDLKNSHINRKLKIKTFIFYVKICTRMKNTLTLVTTI